MSARYLPFFLIAAVVFPPRAALGADDVPALKPPDAKELDRLWADLAATDAVRAYWAVCRLASHADVSVPFLRTRVRPVRPLDDKIVARLVALLDSENFEEREKAQKDLEAFGDPVRIHLMKALEAAPSAEAKRCLEAVLQQLDDEVLSPESVRGVRAVEALEIG